MAALDNKPLANDAPSVTLTVRLIMQGKEVGSIIGKKGDNIKKFREESGAKINISDGSCPERIVTVTGPTESIFKAFSLICKKFEEQQNNQNNQGGAGIPKPPITLRLIVPASQCGSLIGKGGSKIKEIREVTGASIQVASEMLPNSTERAVTISGTSEAITQCIFHICCVMMESPPKGATIPYRPKPAMPPVIFAGGQAYTIQGQYAIPHPDHHPILPTHNLTTAGINPQAMVAMAASNHHLGARAGGAVAVGSVAAASPTATQSHEMSIPNDLIGCVIGKGGAKINEIRQLSGATIKIANTEEGGKERAVTITGTPESISMAQYLINTSLELHKHLTSLAPNACTSSAAQPTSTITSTTAAAIPLAQLVKPISVVPAGMVPILTPTAASATPTATALLDLSSLAASVTSHHHAALAAAAAVRSSSHSSTSRHKTQTSSSSSSSALLAGAVSNFTAKLKSISSSSANSGTTQNGSTKKSERNKFAPY